MIALGVAGVDGEVLGRITGLDDLAEGGEGLAAERAVSLAACRYFSAVGTASGQVRKSS